MDKAAAFTATYSDWRLIKGRKVVQIVMEIPLEAANEAYAVLGGMPNPAAETWCAIARLVQTTGKEDLSNTPSTQPASESQPARAPKNKLSQLAGMLSKTPLFHRYVEANVTHMRNAVEDDAADFIRLRCLVGSRAQILPGTPAGDRFLQLYDDFMLWSSSDAYVEPAQGPTMREVMRGLFDALIATVEEADAKGEPWPTPVADEITRAIVAMYMPKAMAQAKAELQQDDPTQWV